MKNYFKKNKVSIIVTSAALVSAAASAAYALWQKSRAEEKVLKAKADTIWRLRRVREQQTFSPPVKSDFDRIRNRHTGVEMSVQSESLTVTYSDGSVSAVCNGNEVSMELYSLEGKLIARTRNNDRASLETSTLPSGIYIAKAACGETSVVRKIAL